MVKIWNLIRLARCKDWILNIGYLLFGYFLPSPVSYVSLAVLVFVFFAVESFGFALNDYFDAPFDRLKPETSNVISNGLVSRPAAALFCLVLAAAGLSAGFFLLPFYSFVWIAALYLVFFVYSAPPFRLKEKAFLGVASHGFFIPPLLFVSYLSVSPLGGGIVLISIFSFLLSIVVDITQEIRDMNPDRKAGFRTTAIALGYKRSLSLIKASFLAANIILAVAVVIYLPLYFLPAMLSSVFYFKLLLSNPGHKNFFRRSVDSCYKGVAVLLLVMLLVLPFHLGWVSI